jgi:hypothetical protein
MPIFNNACVQDPIAFDATIWPSSIRSEATGEVLQFPRPVSASRYVPPIIRFGSLVFEHQENVDSPFYNAQGSDSVLVGSIPINLSSGQASTELDSWNQPDLDNSQDEINLVQDCHICTVSQHRKVIHTKRSEICTSQSADERSKNVHFVEIAQPGFYMKPCPGGWLAIPCLSKKGILGT